MNKNILSKDFKNAQIKIQLNTEMKKVIKTIDYVYKIILFLNS